MAGSTAGVVDDTKQAVVPKWYYVGVLLVCIASMMVATQVREFSLSWKKAGVLAGGAAVILSLIPHIWAGILGAIRGVKQFFSSQESVIISVPNNKDDKDDKDDEIQFESPKFTNFNSNSTPGGTSESQRERDLQGNLTPTTPTNNNNNNSSTENKVNFAKRNLNEEFNSTSPKTSSTSFPTFGGNG